MNKYNIKGLPWSGGIGKDVKDCVTTEEVMKKSGLDFQVDKCELVARMPFSIKKADELKLDTRAGDFVHGNAVYRDCSAAYATYRTDYNIPLGIVKSKYTVVQNEDAFKFFDDVIKCGQAEWQTAGMFGFGQKIFVSAKLPNTIKVGNDPIDNYLVFSNNHDGSGSVNILFTPVRVFCTNCLAAARRNADAFIRIRHTQSVKEKLDIGAQIIAAAIQQSNSVAEMYNYLNGIKMTDKDVAKYICELNLTDAERLAAIDYTKNEATAFSRIIARNYPTLEAAKISTRKANAIAGMYDYYMNGIAQRDIAGTAWGAYNAITGYYCNVANMEGEKRMDSLLYGHTANVFSEALNSALAYAS